MALRTFVGNFERVALCPDASTVAYAVRSPDRRPAATHSGFLPNGVPGFAGGAEVWVTATTGGSTRVLTHGWGSSWGPRWSPDGRKLAFYSDRNGEPQIWLWDRETDTFRLVCEEPICVRFGFEGIHWLPDGARLVAKLRAPGWNPPASEAEPVGGPRDVWISPKEEAPRPHTTEGWHWYDTGRGDVAVVDVGTGEARRLGTGIFPFNVALSPDGRFVAAMCFGGDDRDGNVVRLDLHLFAVDGSRHDTLAQRIPQAYGTALSWSPRSDAIACTTCGDGPGRLILVSLDGRQRAIDSGEIDLGNEEGFPPLWSSDGQTVYCWANMTVYAISVVSGMVQNLTESLSRLVFGIIYPLGSGTASHFGRPGGVVVVTRDRGTRCECLFRVGGGEPEAVIAEENRFLLGLLPGVETGCDANDRWIVGPVEDAAHPADLFCIDVHSGEERRLTVLNPEIVTSPQVTTRLISFSGTDGRSLQAALCLPSDYEPGKRYPAVVNLYYGEGQSGRVSRFLGSRLTACGYATLYPDMPVSGPNPAETITALALNALDAAVEGGYADPERAGVIGHSLGGYSTCCVVTRTGRFRAAVAVAPFTNLLTFALSIRANTLTGLRWVEGGFVRMGSTFWEDPQRYADNSPVFHLDRVSTPLLLLHGTADGLPITQSEEMYAGLLRLGKVAALVRYHGEGHSPEMWSAENYQDYWRRVIDWFDRFARPCHRDMAPT